MNPETRKRLLEFDISELKQELFARGAGTHAVAATAMAQKAADIGGRADLAEFSSEEISEVMRDAQKVIYGVDNRRDAFAITNAQAAANARSVVSLFRASRILDNGDGTSTLQTGKFGAVNNLCEGEPFREQPAGAFCTGFLVAPDLIATAGHCVNEANVTTVRFVFGFQMTDATTAQLRLPNADIYAGAAVVGRKLTDDETDWCLVRLDRPVAGRQILALRSAGKIADGAGLYVLGHPSGLPLKFADGANVRDNSAEAFFSANLDTYGGNSGSPVFNSETHDVEGILVRGSTDFVPVGFCMVSAVCPTTGCGGEDCTRVSEFTHLLPGN